MGSCQQWTIGPVDGEIVPLYGEMLHPTQNHTYQREMERKNIIYMYHSLSFLIHKFQFKETLFFFQRQMVQQREMERKNTIYISFIVFSYTHFNSRRNCFSFEGKWFNKEK